MPMTISAATRGLTALLIFLTWLGFAQAKESVELYQKADIALKKGQLTEYKKLRAQLNEHPLAIYLDYRYLSPRISQLSAQQVLDFKHRALGSPLEPRLVAKYLKYIGKRRQWQNFLKVSETEPTRTELRCYYNRALLSTGQKNDAFKGAAGLWLSGSSQPDACDPLFRAWHKAGFRTNQHVWERMLLAFDARKGSLLSYLSQLLTGDYVADGQNLLGLYRNPRRLSRIEVYSLGPRAKDLVSAGLRKLARTSPSQAVRYWRKYEAQLDFGLSQQTEIKRQLVLYAYSRKDKAASQWADQQLKGLQIDQLTERRLRQLLKAQQWPQLRMRLEALSPAEQQSERWQYWLAKLEQQDGASQKAKERLQSISTKRSYYSYLAAAELGQEYQLAEQYNEPTLMARQFVMTEPGYLRVQALMAADEAQNANSEWVYLLRRTSNEQKLAMAYLAQEQGWWHLGISAAIRAQAWHDLHLRFPQAYDKEFQQFAKMRKLDVTLLMAIARRESTYNPHARSSKNARGLMQLMPATASATARKIRLRYKGSSSLYDASTNIRLGSAYIKQLLRQFNGNKILAIAAYNAGPHRVKSWLNDGTPLPFDIWVETIPFRETRDYVQAVLAYQVIYQQKFMPSLDFAMLSDREEGAIY